MPLVPLGWKLGGPSVNERVAWDSIDPKEDTCLWLYKLVTIFEYKLYNLRVPISRSIKIVILFLSDTWTLFEYWFPMHMGLMGSLCIFGIFWILIQLYENVDAPALLICIQTHDDHDDITTHDGKRQGQVAPVGERTERRAQVCVQTAERQATQTDGRTTHFKIRTKQKSQTHYHSIPHTEHVTHTKPFSGRVGTTPTKVLLSILYNSTYSNRWYA